MIYVKGDLMTVERGVIVQGCNAQGVQGSGVAKVIRAKYPDVYQNYKTDLDFGNLDMGDISWTWYYVGQEEHTKSLAIASAITQEFYGSDGARYVSYDAIDTAMDTVFEIAKLHDLPVSMPKICAGLGGGDWSIIEAIIKSAAKNNNFPEDRITVYEL